MRSDGLKVMTEPEDLSKYWSGLNGWEVTRHANKARSSRAHNAGLVLVVRIVRGRYKGTWQTPVNACKSPCAARIYGVHRLRMSRKRRQRTSEEMEETEKKEGGLGFVDTLDRKAYVLY